MTPLTLDAVCGTGTLWGGRSCGFLSGSSGSLHQTIQWGHGGCLTALCIACPTWVLGRTGNTWAHSLLAVWWQSVGVGVVLFALSPPVIVLRRVESREVWACFHSPDVFLAFPDANWGY